MVVGYPSHAEERMIIDLAEQQDSQAGTAISITQVRDILDARKAVVAIHLSDKLKDYVVSLVTATRNPEEYDATLATWLSHGASPRATLAIIRCSKALAWLQGSGYVTPHHVQRVALPILRHRIFLSFESEAEGITRAMIVKRLLEVVAIP